MKAGKTGTPTEICRHWYHRKCCACVEGQLVPALRLLHAGSLEALPHPRRPGREERHHHGCLPFGGISPILWLHDGSRSRSRRSTTCETAVHDQAVVAPAALLQGYLEERCGLALYDLTEPYSWQAAYAVLIMRSTVHINSTKALNWAASIVTVLCMAVKWPRTLRAPVFPPSRGTLRPTSDP